MTYFPDASIYPQRSVLESFTAASPSENFKASELDKLFKVNTVKTSFSGASYKEINDVLERALGHNPNIKMWTPKILLSYHRSDQSAHD